MRENMVPDRLAQCQYFLSLALLDSDVDKGRARELAQKVRAVFRRDPIYFKGILALLDAKFPER